jgi:hypothetical protein
MVSFAEVETYLGTKLSGRAIVVGSSSNMDEISLL